MFAVLKSYAEWPWGEIWQIRQAQVEKSGTKLNKPRKITAKIHQNTLAYNCTSCMRKRWSFGFSTRKDSVHVCSLAISCLLPSDLKSPSLGPALVAIWWLWWLWWLYIWVVALSQGTKQTEQTDTKPDRSCSAVPAHQGDLQEAKDPLLAGNLGAIGVTWFCRFAELFSNFSVAVADFRHDDISLDCKESSTRTTIAPLRRKSLWRCCSHFSVAWVPCPLDDMSCFQLIRPRVILSLEQVRRCEQFCSAISCMLEVYEFMWPPGRTGWNFGLFLWVAEALKSPLPRCVILRCLMSGSCACSYPACMVCGESLENASGWTKTS